MDNQSQSSPQRITEKSLNFDQDQLSRFSNPKFDFGRPVEIDDSALMFNKSESFKENTNALILRSNTTQDRIFQILKMAIPAILNNTIRQLFQVINLHFVGKLNDPAMIAGVGMGNMTVQILGLIYIMGFNSVLDTLVSQAAGAGNLQLCAILQNRGQIFVALLFIPIICINMHAETLLVFVGQHKEVAKYSQQYIIAFLPGLFFQGIGDCQMKLLNNLGKTQIPFMCSIFGIIVHYTSCQYFVIDCGYGLNGTGIALFCTYFIIYITMFLWARCEKDIEAAVALPNKRAFQNLLSYGKMGVPLTFMMMLDQWAWELMVLLSGFFTIYEQAAQIILCSIVGICYMVGMGLDQTACAIIGNLIGEGNYREAQLYYRALVITSVSITTTVALLVMYFADSIISSFTNNHDLAQIAKSVIHLIAFCSIPDSVKGMMKGVIKALGAQDQCVKVNLIGHCGINLTLQLLLAFYFEMHLTGMWMAKCILEYFIVNAYALLICQQDWELITKTVRERLELEDKRSTTSSDQSGDEYLHQRSYIESI